MQVKKEIIQRQGDRSKSCDGKVRYGHQGTAAKTVEAMKRKRGRELEAYLCQFCDGWHVGHSNAAILYTFTPGGL